MSLSPSPAVYSEPKVEVKSKVRLRIHWTYENQSTE